MSKIEVRLTPKQRATLKQIDAQDNQLELAIESAQQFVDQNEWKKGFSVFAMNGYYKHDSQKTRVLFLMINNLDQNISQFSAQLHPIIKTDLTTEFSVANVALNTDYLGVVSPQQAILFFVDIPTRGLQADKHFKFNDFGLQMYSILYS